MRLACQLRPTGDVSVQPLVAVEQEWWRPVAAARTTTEREVAVLFFEVRFGAAGGSEAASAHDTLYALDHFHAIATAAIGSADGVPCGHSGDSWMALFGLDDSGVRGSFRQAMVAAQQIEERFAALTFPVPAVLGLRGAVATLLRLGGHAVGPRGEHIGWPAVLLQLGYAVLATVVSA